MRVISVVLVALLFGTLLAAVRAADEAPIDLERGKQLMHKLQAGEKLTPEEQAYLDRVRQEIRKRAGQGGTKGAGPKAASGQIPGEADWQQLPDGSLGHATEFLGSGGTPIPAYIRKPKGPGKFPVVVLLHGGFPTKEGTYGFGNRTTAPTGNFVAAGWAVYAIDFRTPNSILQKVEWDDTIAAVETVRRMDFIDGERVARMGGSHGGYVMAKVLSRVDARCAILCSPAMIDLIESFKFIATGAETNPALNKTVKELEQAKGVSIEQIAKDPKAYGYESPLTEAPQARCSVLFINGTNDPNSPIPVIEAYGKALRDSGHEVEFYLPENAHHGLYFGNPHTPKTEDAAKRAVAFIRKHFQ